MEAYQQVRTGDEFATEEDAWSAFDRVMEAKDEYFRVNKEVSGEVIQPRAGTGSAGVRIDRLIVPTSRACEAGWRHGPFGVEGKRSGKKVGPVIAQAMDYARSAFFLANGFTVVLEWVFVWPLDTVPGDLGSVMAQSRIGYCHFSGKRLVFGCGGMNGLVVSADSVSAKELPMGRKRGSRK